MTDQRELDRVLGAFFAVGTDEVADRVIDAALDQIDHTHQRRPLRMPRRIQTMPMLTRLAAAAVIGVLAVGGALYLLKPGQQAVVGAPSQSPGASATSTPTPGPTQTPAPTPTDRPHPPGPMGVGRQIHTATQLLDGRVLIAGGYDYFDGMLASAAVYDPASDAFSQTGSMATGRGLHTATLLADGRVLITGGGPLLTVVAGSPFASAELYDPRTGTFSPTGSMTTVREDQTATRLRDGRVLVTGGNDTADHAVASAELYDPKTGTFSPTGSMATARSFHSATLLSDGRVLIAGGSPSGWSWTTPLLATAEIYDPVTGTFTPTGSLASSRLNHAATLLADGRVLVTGGGANDGSELASSEIFDPKTGKFTTISPMVQARTYHTATLLSDGRVLVAGGGGDYTNRQFLASAEIYDPRTGTFAATGPMAESRTYHQASLLKDGRVLVTGGYGALAPLASAELFDLKTGTFSPAGTGG